jgi:serine/threonine-protein kinase RsbW
MLMDKPVIHNNTITIPSNLEYLIVVDEFVEGILRGYGADESLVADIAISVSELVNNSISHGNAADTTKLVSVSVKCNNSEVAITITDEGQGFDPKCLESPLSEENLLKDSGRGIFIVQQLMDDIDVEITDRGTKIIIKKNIQ